jgi:hypothetical protein
MMHVFVITNASSIKYIYLSNNTSTSFHPQTLAISKAVSPSSFFAARSAPSSSKADTKGGRFRSADRWRRVWPYSHSRCRRKYA